MTEIKLAKTTPPESLKELADDLREVADDIEAGKVIAVTWVEHMTGDKFRTAWVKAKGVSKTELLGGATALMMELGNSLQADDR